MSNDYLNGLRALADGVRVVAEFIRTNQLTIRTRTWSGSFVGDGTATDVDLVLPPRYKVRHVLMKEVFGSGGAYETSDVLVDHITPYDGVSAGYTPAQLRPVVTAQNVQVLYLILGEHGGEYSLVECRTYRPFTYQLVLRRTRVTP